MDAKDYREIMSYWFGSGYLLEAQSHLSDVEILSGRVKLAMEHIKLLGETLMDALAKLHTTNSELARRRKYEEILGLREELASKDEILGAQQACITYMSEQLNAE